LHDGIVKYDFWVPALTMRFTGVLEPIDQRPKDGRARRAGSTD